MIDAPFPPTLKISSLGVSLSDSQAQERYLNNNINIRVFKMGFVEDVIIFSAISGLVRFINYSFLCTLTHNRANMLNSWLGILLKNFNVLPRDGKVNTK